MEEEGWCRAVDANPEKNYRYVCFAKPTVDLRAKLSGQMGSGEAKIEPLATVIAALRAKGVPEEEIQKALKEKNP